jgi:hypothetical protein
VYVVAFTHVDGQPLDGANRYTLRFEKARFPGYYPDGELVCQCRDWLVNSSALVVNLTDEDSPATRFHRSKLSILTAKALDSR